MRAIPLKQYRDWPDANYEDPVTRGNELLVVNIVFITLVTFSIVVRIYSRLTQSRPGVDDILIFIAYIFTCGLCAVVIMANRDYGWDRHIWDVPMEMAQGASILAFCAKLTFVFASSFTRLSLIFLYYRLIKESTTKWYRWSIHLGLAYNLATTLVLIFLGIFGCVPIKKYWQFPDIVDGHCLNEGVITMASGIMTCVADLLCTCLPIPIIMRLHMPLRERIGVVVLLSAGIIVTIAGVLRTVFIWQALIETYDESWHTYPLWICAAVEIDLAVICACVPAMKAVIWKPFQKWSGQIYSQFSSSNRDTRNDKSRIELTSQDPIVEDTRDDMNKSYRLTSMDFGKPGSPNEQEQERYPSRLEKSIGRLPSTTNLHRSDRDSKKSSQVIDDFAKPSRLEISKETSFQVSCVSDGESPKDGSQSSLTALPSVERANNNSASNRLSSKGQPYNATAKVDWD